METSDWIAFGALSVSFLALTLSLYEHFSNRQKLRVTLSSAAISSDYVGVLYSSTPKRLRADQIGTNGIEMVAVDITNFGRQPTMIKSIGFKLSHSNSEVTAPPASPAEEVGTSLPAEISPGQFRTFYFDGRTPIQYDKGAIKMSLAELAFLSDAEIQIRHSWKKKPKIIRGIHKV